MILLKGVIMKYIFIFLGLFVISYFVIMILLPSIKYKKAKKILQEKYMAKECSKQIYDFIIDKNNLKMYIKVVDIPSNSMITINSKDTWKLSYGGSKSNLGRSYPNSKYLDELKPFLKMNIKDEMPFLKVILLNKETEKIVRYLNESELEVVTINDTPYGYKILSLSKFEEELKVLGIN